MTKSSFMRKEPPFSDSILKWCMISVICLFLPFAAYAQQQKITANIKELPLREAVENIAKMSSMNIGYSKEFVDTDKKVWLNVKDATLEHALTTMLKGTNIGYRFLDGSILLFNKEQQTKSTPTGDNKKEITVTGTIYDEFDESLVGATVSMQGTTKGTMTDIDGNYSITVPIGSTLVYSYVGYAEITRVANVEKIDVSMTENTIALDDIVVVGYGVQKKINVTGAVSMVKGDAIESRPITNVSSGLQGLLPGVSIVSSSGQPGSVPSIKIRGTSTINSSTSPLILIDGVAGGDLNLLNPSDIESVSVLKDAASASIYGARAANGVILITTKKGEQKEKITFQYTGYAGWQKATAMPKLVNGREYMELSNEAMAAAGFSKPYTPEAFAKYDSGLYPNEFSNTDWIDQIYKNSAFQTGHNISARGGSDKTGFFMSYGFLDQDGLVVGDAFKSRRHNARVSVNTEVFNRLKLSGQLSYVDFMKRDLAISGTGGVFRLAQRTSPLLPVKWQEEGDDGRWGDSPYWSHGSVTNPLQVAYEGGTEKRNTRVTNALFNADFKIVEGLHLGGQYSANIYGRQNDVFRPFMLKYFADGTPHSDNNKESRDYISQSQLNILTQTVNFTLNYNKTINKHQFGALAGFSQEWEDRNNLSASRNNVMVEDIHVLDAGLINMLNGGTKEDWAIRSYFGRLNYVFDDKYMLEANLRADGTSRFAKGNRWGYFPSFSGGWNFSRESFMEFVKPALTSGKLRASWGELGNQYIPGDYYPYSPAILTEQSYPIGGNNIMMGLWQKQMGNNHIKWETIRMLNLGVDMSFLNNRLQASFDWYKKDNKNALVQQETPSIVGVPKSDLAYINLGAVQVKGWEVEVSWRDNIGEVNYNIGINVSDARNKITDLGGTPPVLGNNIRRVGDPIGAFYGYLTDGLAQALDFGRVNTDGKYTDPKFAVPLADKGKVQPGDIKYRDVNNDGVIDDKDKVVFGDAEPHYSYSIRGGAEWRGIDFSFYFQGVGKVNGYLSEEARHAFINDYSIPKVEHLDRWTPTNINASYPRMYQSQTHNLLFSDYWKEDASYLRLKNIQVGYRFPAKLVKPLGIGSLRVYASADNVFTISDYFGAYDPEVRTSAGDSYPQVKTYTFGLSVTF